MRKSLVVGLGSLMVALVKADETVTSEKTCTALVLSGGGSNGAWEAGVFWGLLHYGDPADYRYDVLAGVSAGSINAGSLSNWEIGDELAASEWLSESWDSMTTSNVYIEWPGGYSAALWKPSAFDTSVGLAYLTDRMKEFDGFKRKVSLATTDINTGECLTFGDHNIEWSELPQAVLASAAVPGFFPPQNFKGHLLVDGMTAWNTNAQQAIDRCKEIVDHERNIIIDVITIGVSDDQKEIVEVGYTSSNYLRSRNIKSAHNGGDALDE
jgi:NTE family protein